VTLPSKTLSSKNPVALPLSQRTRRHPSGVWSLWRRRHFHGQAIKIPSTARLAGHHHQFLLLHANVLRSHAEAAHTISMPRRSERSRRIHRVPISCVTRSERPSRHVTWRTSTSARPPKPTSAVHAECLQRAVGVEHFDGSAGLQVDVVERLMLCPLHGKSRSARDGLNKLGGSGFRAQGLDCESWFTDNVQNSFVFDRTCHFDSATQREPHFHRPVIEPWHVPC